MPTEAAELVFDEATKVYPGREGAAVDHLSLTVPAGEICVLVGPARRGQTTAPQLLNPPLPPTSGGIRIRRTPIPAHGRVPLRRPHGQGDQPVGLFPLTT